MADTEKVISKLKDLIRELKYTGEKHKDDVVPTFGTNINIMCYDVINHVECAIQTIRELQEERCEYAERLEYSGENIDSLNVSLTDAFEKVRELQEQNKWHFVANGDFPPKPEKYSEPYLVYLRGSKYASYAYWTGKEFITSRADCVDPIAWLELPKFEEVE